METNKQTATDFIKSLQIIYYALIAGQVLFGLMTIYLNVFADFASEKNSLKEPFLYIVPIFVIIGIVSSNFMFKRKLPEIKNNTRLIDKLEQYKAALIIRYALLEGPSLLSIIVYLITGAVIFIALAGLIIAVFLILKPTKENIAQNLELNPGEINSLNSFE